MTLYVSDLDGTLLNYAKRIKPRAASMLNRMTNKGILFTYATARSYETSKIVTNGLKLDIPIITMNGAIISDFKSGEKLYIEKINHHLHSKACDFFKEQKESPLIYSVIDHKDRVSYLENHTVGIEKYIAERKDSPRLRPCRSYSELFEGEIYYYTLLNARSELKILNAIFTEHNGCSVNYQSDTYSDNDFWYEIFNVNVSKANSAKKLQKMLNADRLVVFGDNTNDISMFKVADESYAVQNATAELKKYATAVIPSNEEMGVPRIIEKKSTTLFDYSPKPEIFMNPDNEKFELALYKAMNRQKGTIERDKIGTLNEKLIHSSLKFYFASDIDHEAKIGSYYADAVNDNGIIEIQTSNWGKLKDKLDVFLDACHVTVVYPFLKKIHHSYIDEKSGELMKKSPPRSYSNYTEFFLELYRIKEFLTNPNLTFCIAELEIEKLCYMKNKNNYRQKKQRTEKIPLKLIGEIYLNEREDFKVFLPQNLPEKFNKKQFCKLSKKCEGSILLEIFEYFSIVHKIGKEGNSFIYSVSPQ